MSTSLAPPSNALVAALQYIAEGRTLRGTPEPAKLVRALLSLVEHGDDKVTAAAEDALKVSARSAVASKFDTAAELLAVGEVAGTPARLREALLEVERHTTSKRLDTITSAAVAAAHAQNNSVLEALAAIAGLTWKELKARAEAARPDVRLPGSPGNRRNWTPEKVAVAFDMIDKVVRGASRSVMGAPADGRVRLSTGACWRPTAQPSP